MDGSKIRSMKTWSLEFILTTSGTPLYRLRLYLRYGYVSFIASTLARRGAFRFTVQASFKARKARATYTPQAAGGARRETTHRRTRCYRHLRPLSDLALTHAQSRSPPRAPHEQNHPNRVNIHSRLRKGSTRPKRLPRNEHDNSDKTKQKSAIGRQSVLHATATKQVQHAPHPAELQKFWEQLWLGCVRTTKGTPKVPDIESKPHGLLAQHRHAAARGTLCEPFPTLHTPRLITRLSSACAVRRGLA